MLTVFIKHNKVDIKEEYEEKAVATVAQPIVVNKQLTSCSSKM